MAFRSLRSITLWLAAASASGLAASAILAADAEPAAEKIARAMRAAPSSLSADATITDVDGTLLRPGTNGWTCMPGMAAGDAHPMCNDGVWAKFMKALAAKGPFQTDRIGVSYMLEGDAAVNNADPFDTEPGPGEVWVEEGPHLMILVPDPALLAGLPTDPNHGGPYVMWQGTPYAHIMIPTGARPE